MPPTRRLLGLWRRSRGFLRSPWDWPRGVSPPPGGERGDVPPLDAYAPPSAASAADSGGGLRLSRAPDPPTPRAAASLTGLPPVALGPPGGERGDVPPLDACAPPSAASAAPSGGGLRAFPRPRPADSSGCGIAHGASSGRPRACFPSRRRHSRRRAFVGGDKGIKCTVNLRERVVFHIFAV